MALTNRDFIEARKVLNQLYTTEPGNVRLGGLERLLEAAENLHNPISAPENELEFLQQKLIPLAEDLLGTGSRHYLAPLWRRLTNAISTFSFNPLQPLLHSSYTAIRMEDWAGVRSHVEKEPDWQRQPELLKRYTIACRRSNLEDDALVSWFILCWNFPDQAEQFEERTNREWLYWWNEFIDLDPELPNQDFPTWLLLRLPALSKRFEGQEILCSTPMPQTFMLILEVLSKPKAELDADTIEIRRRLQMDNPALFAHYMRSQRL